VNNAVLNHHMGLSRYRASCYLAHLLTHEAKSGLLALRVVHLLSLPSDPTLIGTPLRLGLTSPWVGCRPLLSASRDCLPNWANYKKARRMPGLVCRRQSTPRAIPWRRVPPQLRTPPRCLKSNPQFEPPGGLGHWPEWSATIIGGKPNRADQDQLA